MTLQILLPVGPRDSYFPETEFFFPKPLVEIGGMPMIERVVRGLQRIKMEMKFVFVVQNEDCRRFSLDNILQLLCDDKASILRLRNVTAGAVASCLLAVDSIDPEQELVIANSDQVIDSDLSAVLAKFRQSEWDAGVISFSSMHPRWSYIRVNEVDRVTEAAEKRVISRHAIAGFYWFRRAGDFFQAAKDLVLDEVTVDDRYYIAPCLNYFIIADKVVGHYRIDKADYHSWYKPDAIKAYEAKM